MPRSTRRAPFPGAEWEFGVAPGREREKGGGGEEIKWSHEMRGKEEEGKKLSIK